MPLTLTPDDPRLGWHNAAGLERYGDGLLLARVPAEWRNGFNPQRMAELAAMPAGLELRLRTDGASVTLLLDVNTESDQGPCPVQWLVGDLGAERFEGIGSASPRPGPQRVKLEAPGNGVRPWRVLFKRNAFFRLLGVELPDGSAVEPWQDRPSKWTLLTYGDSITQGATASLPSTAYTFQLQERLGVPLLNLGFSGHGFAHKAETDYFCSRDDWNAALIAIGTNSAGQAKSPAATLADDYRAMLAALRAARPGAPIVCLSPLWRGLDDQPGGNEIGEPMAAYRAAVEDTVNSLRATGDANLHLVEGLTVIGSDRRGMLPDELHPNDEGMTRMADCLEPVLRNALGM